MIRNRKLKGFTLAELLIALAILGVIATFTIPKVLQVQQDSRNNAIAKEVAGNISDVYHTLQLKGLTSAATKFSDLTPYLNYVGIDTATNMDNDQTRTTELCGTNGSCLKLHNGALIMYSNFGFCDSSNLSALWVDIDPDGKVTDGTTNGPGKSVTMWLYTDGHLRTWSTIDANTKDGGCVTKSATPAYDPPWFSWN